MPAIGQEWSGMDVAVFASTASRWIEPSVNKCCSMCSCGKRKDFCCMWPTVDRYTIFNLRMDVERTSAARSVRLFLGWSENMSRFISRHLSLYSSPSLCPPPNPLTDEGRCRETITLLLRHNGNKQGVIWCTCSPSLLFIHKGDNRREVRVKQHCVISRCFSFAFVEEIKSNISRSFDFIYI